MIELTNYYHFPPDDLLTEQWAISAQLIGRMELLVSSWRYRWIPCQLKLHLADRTPSLNGNEFPPSLNRFFNSLEEAISTLKIFEESGIAWTALIEKKAHICLRLYSPKNSEHADEYADELQAVSLSDILFLIRSGNALEIHTQSNEILSRRFRNIDEVKEEFQRLTTILAWSK